MQQMQDLCLVQLQDAQRNSSYSCYTHTVPQYNSRRPNLWVAVVPVGPLWPHYPYVTAVLGHTRGCTVGRTGCVRHNSVACPGAHCAPGGHGARR